MRQQAMLAVLSQGPQIGDWRKAPEGLGLRRFLVFSQGKSCCRSNYGLWQLLAMFASVTVRAFVFSILIRGCCYSQAFADSRALSFAGNIDSCIRLIPFPLTIQKQLDEATCRFTANCRSYIMPGVESPSEFNRD